MPRGKKNLESENTVETKVTKSKRSLDEIMAEKEEQLQKKELTELEKRRLERKKQMELVKNIEDTLPILMYCNAGNTTVVYDCPKTMQHYEMRYGDVEYMTYLELKTMKSLHPTMLENYLLIPIDVNSDEFTLEDILKLLKIDGLYGEEMLIDGNIDYILNELKSNTFESLLKDTNRAYVQLVIDRAIELAKKGEFNDYSKMTILENISNIPELFKDAIENYKLFK